ncbi:MAG TPA: BadF/BadG/BcrA/BcrD ATPase family protein [Acidobacteriaceae bacterium]|nr:BadF/BadG/BcrA/BcrD ATPase family protein [Acidobacteriaceae bacterium]
MSLFLAIDAGGTKADYMLADETRVLATVRSGSIKRMRVSAEVANENLMRALAELESQSGRSLSDVEVTCIGTAGETVPLVTDWLRQELGASVGGRLLLLGDVEIALDAAFPDSYGVLILAGTGSNVRGRAPNGSMTGAGGHGPMLADQGSGHRIGQRALREIFRAIDEERDTSLLPGVLAHWGLKDVDDLVAYANTCDLTEFAALTPLVQDSAQAGDAVATDLLVQEGQELADLALLAHRKLERIEGESIPPRFAFAGSVLLHVTVLRDVVIASLRTQFPTAEIQTTPSAPIEGALFRARHAGGRTRGE